MGRPPGAKNKITHNTKANIEQVFDLLGGTQGLYKWAQENPGAFYLGMYSKLLPKNVEATVNVRSLEDLIVESSTETDLVVEGSNVIAIESRNAEDDKS